MSVEEKAGRQSGWFERTARWVRSWFGGGPAAEQVRGEEAVQVRLLAASSEPEQDTVEVGPGPASIEPGLEPSPSEVGPSEVGPSEASPSEVEPNEASPSEVEPLGAQIATAAVMEAAATEAAATEAVMEAAETEAAETGAAPSHAEPPLRTINDLRAIRWD